MIACKIYLSLCLFLTLSMLSRSLYILLEMNTVKSKWKDIRVIYMEFLSLVSQLDFKGPTGPVVGDDANCHVINEN